MLREFRTEVGFKGMNYFIYTSHQRLDFLKQCRNLQAFHCSEYERIDNDFNAWNKNGKKKSVFFSILSHEKVLEL